MQLCAALWIQMWYTTIFSSLIMYIYHLIRAFPIKAISDFWVFLLPYCFFYWPKENGSQVSPVFTFGNQAGLDMLETTLVALQDIMLEKVLDEGGRKVLSSEFSKIMQQVQLV